MSDPVFPESLIVLQRASTTAWDEVEARRKQVDARRRRAAAAKGAEPDQHRPWTGAPLEPWTDDDDARHAELLAAARTAAEALRAGIQDAGLDGGYEVAQGLHKAARASA